MQDPRGHLLSTRSETAAAACNAGVDGYVRWRLAAVGHLEVASEADSGFALPVLVRGWMLHGARGARFAPRLAELLSTAEATVNRDDERECAVFEALLAARAGQDIMAATVLEALLDRYPTDLLAHRLVQFELFWNGRSRWMRDVAERAAPHWHPGLAGYPAYQSMRAFAAEEAGDYAHAERCGREAVEFDPTDPWGAHAVAHVLLMQHRIDEGAAWLEGLAGNWGEVTQFRHHLWWHYALFALERGEHERVLALVTSEIRNPDSPLVQAAPDATVDIQNVASLLLRLELRGVDVGEHWSILADVCAGRVADHSNAFGSVHDMMVLAATGQIDAARTLLANLREFAAANEGTLANAYRSAGVAAGEAVLAHRLGDHATVVSTLSPVRHDLPLIGASHAQRDVLYQLLVDSARRLERADLVRIYLRDVERIGFVGVDGRTLYREAA